MLPKNLSLKAQNPLEKINGVMYNISVWQARLGKLHKIRR